MILLSSHLDIGIATTQLQNDLTKLDTCCFDNKLTKTMIFGPRHITKKTTIDPFYMKQHRLEMDDHYKYLGITLNKCLTFNLHLSNVIQQVTETGYLLRKIRPYLDEESSLLIYKTMILPYAASLSRKQVWTFSVSGDRIYEMRCPFVAAHL